MILVTGITGKSGSWFLKKLILESDKFSHLHFRAIVRDISKVKNIDIGRVSIEFVEGDLEDEQFLSKSMHSVDTVLHIANIALSLNIVNAALNKDVKRLILVHTTGIYSKFKSASAGYLDIESKIEKLIAGKKINLTILRPTMIYGSVADGNVIVFLKMVDKFRIFPVVNHAKYLLQPVHEKDLGEAYFKVLLNEEATRNKNYILSGGEPILLIDIFKIMANYLNKNNYYVSIPFSIAFTGAWFVFLISFGRIDFRERVQRLIEPRNYSHDEASKDFGYFPMKFDEGIKSEIEEYLLNKNSRLRQK